ncbi:MAG: bacterial Ig-like domain-containing protein, partial [Candidatus Fimenecus sp.]
LGLFANVTGSVHDLTFEGGRISSTYSGANLAIYAGAVSGYADCAVVSKVVNAMDEIHGSSEYANIYCGGIIGCGKKVSVFLCENRATLYSYSNTYSGGSSGIKSVYAGGLLGYMVGGNISECFNTGTIEAVNYNHNGSYSPYSTYAYSAGICGYGTGTMTKCYNAGKVYANRKFTSNSSTYGKRCSAGICYSGTISQCYNVNSVTADNGNSYAIGGTTTTDSYYLSGTGNNTVGSTALTEAQMKLQSMYTGFDFENTWVLNAYAKYPYPQLKTNIQDLSDAVSVVSIISLPLKTDYLTGDALVLDGCTIEVIYASGENEIHSVSADMISGYDEAVTGEQTVTVTYGGVSDTFTVNVSARPSVVKIEMASQPTETEFLVGTSFDFSGAKILVYYADDTTETLNVTDTMTSGGNIYHLGDQTITVTYLGATVTFNVCVIPVTISCLRLEKEPNKLSYIEGQSLDLSGMELIAVMNDGTEKPITTGYAVSGYTATPGTDTVTLSYMGKSVSFQVEIQARTVVELSLNSAPDKTEYVAGQSFDPTGMKIVATYDNGDVEIVQDYAVSGFDSMPGYKTVTISYGGKYVAILITVVARVITDFQITSYPTKQEYLQYESLDLTGLTVQATYNDGTIEEVTDYEIVGFSSNVGAHTVSVAYKGWVQTFTINVSSRVLTHIVVTSPDKLTYCLGETLDTTGLTVTACYNNGQQISVDDYTISGFNSNEAGTQIVTVSYGGCTSAFSVCVSQRSEIETEGNFAVGHVAGRLGETVSIPVTVSNNTGIAGFKQTIRFDKNTLRFVSAEGIGIYGNGTWIVNTENAENGEVVIVWFGTENINENGAVYNLSFEILETAKDGNSAISITFENNDIGNISGENVLFGRIDGSVDVLSYWLGDLSGDRVYTMVDLLQLAQYVSGKQMILTDKQKLAADVNEDGNIDIHDVILLQQWLLVADM